MPGDTEREIRRSTEAEIRLSQLMTADYQRCQEALARQGECLVDELCPEDHEYPDGVVPRWEDWVDYEA